jgi:hypothetical protein
MRTVRTRGGWLAIAAAVAGCTGEGTREVGEGDDGIASLTAADTEPAATAADDDGVDDGATGNGDSPADSDTLSFDVAQGEGGEVGDTTSEGCQAVDFLFVIDNSASMEAYQAALVAAFPLFMQEIQDALPHDDYQVLVTDTDAWGRCNTANPWNGNDPGSDLCTNYIKNTVFEECDRTRGAGVLHPAGKFATNGVCDPAGDQRYIVQGDPDPVGTFACMATVGTAGDASERPMDSLVAAVAADINGVGGCNEGFLRDDAVLVVTFISDDPHYEDSGDPQIWYDAVLAAKHDDPAAVVMLGITPDWPGCRDGDGNTKGAHWHEFVTKWGDQGLHGNVCSTAEEYLAFFEQAVAVIDSACDEFEPPG